MPTKAVDCSVVLTDAVIKALKTANYNTAIRYIGPWSKCLTATEAKALSDAGLEIVSVYEGDPVDKAYFTATQARTDITQAKHYAGVVGQTADSAIYFTVDFDAQAADLQSIINYFGFILDGLSGYVPGAYGSDFVLDALYNVYGDKLKYWQTSAWSSGNKFAHAAMYQNTYHLTISGDQFDANVVYTNPGSWTLKGGNTMTYPNATAYINGKKTPALDIHGDTYLIWTVAKEFGANLTKIAPNNVYIDGKRPPQVFQGGNTYLLWSSIPGIVATPRKAGGFDFSEKAAQPETHNYTLAVTEPAKAPVGTWASISIKTLDNGKPLGHQVITLYENGKESAKDYTDATTGEYPWALTESSDVVDTMKVEWTDPAGKLHTVTHTTEFYTPEATKTPLPPDENVVVQFPINPESDAYDAVFFNLTTPSGETIEMQLDTGAFELMFNKDAATKLGLKNEGALTISGVGGNSQAYYSHATFKINGVEFTDIPCTVNESFTGKPLFGFKFFVDNGYDLLVSEKHNTVTILK